MVRTRQQTKRILTKEEQEEQSPDVKKIETEDTGKPHIGSKRSSTSSPSSVSSPVHKSRRKKEAPQSSSQKKKSKEHKETQTHETGKVLFFYRPKVDHDKVNSFKDVQKLFVVLKPQQQWNDERKELCNSESPHRLLIIPKKQLPEIDSRQRLWSFVKQTSFSIDDIKKSLDEEHYHTKTRGERTVLGARPAGEGVYSVVQHKDHTHFAYVLEVPDHIGQVQKALNVAKEGTFVIAIKNPDVKSPAYVGLSAAEKAEYPENLRKCFDGKRYHPLNIPQLIDYAGAELLLIGASKHVEEELGGDGHLLEELVDPTMSPREAMEEMHMKASREHPDKSLTKEEWI